MPRSCRSGASRTRGLVAGHDRLGREVVKAGLKPADVKAIGLSGQMRIGLSTNMARSSATRPLERPADRGRVPGDRRAAEGTKLIRMVANPAKPALPPRKSSGFATTGRRTERTAKVLLPKVEIRRRLTGEFATEVSDASGMLLLDVEKRKWSKSPQRPGRDPVCWPRSTGQKK